MLSIAVAASSSSAADSPSLQDIVEAWLASPHADRSAEAFTHWDEDGAVREDCATCHSGPGLLDFLGGDGTAVGVVDRPAPTGAPIDCVACHNQAATALETVEFPSGVTVSSLGHSAVCNVCHQGRASTDSVDRAVADLEDDTVYPDLRFLNVHYAAAAATRLGAMSRGGFQYEGRSYARRFSHVRVFDNCAECHDPHSTVVELDTCSRCHGGKRASDFRTSGPDYDGDGNRREGIHGEVVTLHEELDVAIRTYAEAVALQPIVYEADTYPYFFHDSDGDGIASESEAVFPNRYQSWTPRLLKAAYNYQFVAKDPGGYAHNPHYVLQLLFDSLESLSMRTGTDISAFRRP